MDLQFINKAFEDLSNSELYELLKLRQEIFIVEQKCPYLDCDGVDPACHHVLGYTNLHELAAVARIVPPGEMYSEYASIGRVAVAKKFRGNDLGRAIMREALEYCLDHFHGSEIKIMVQSYLKKFYTDLGFESSAEAFLEDEIPHINMYYRIKA